MPPEVKIKIIAYLDPWDIIRCSRVSRGWHQLCYDGQLWSILDTAGFSKGVPAEAVMTIMTKAGPFMRDLNLRGVKMRDCWNIRGLPEACENLKRLSLGGYKVHRTAIRSFLNAKNRLVHIDFSGLAAATNRAMEMIAVHCHELQRLDISRCSNINTCGLQKVIAACPDLRDIRADKVSGWGNIEFMQQLFLGNNLERLILKSCDTLTDESLAVLIEGNESEVNSSTGTPIVPPRKLKHLDLSRCRGISGRGVRALVNNIPKIECLRLSDCHGISDDTLTQLVQTTPVLAHLDLEKLDALTNAVLHSLANSPCAKRLRHVNISDCESMGDSGILTLLGACRGLRSLEMDNTHITDLSLVAAVDLVRQRTSHTIHTDRIPLRPAIGLFLKFYDCSHVTWGGICEILSHNARAITTIKVPQLPRVERYFRGSSGLVTDLSSYPTTSNKSPSFRSTDPSARNACQCACPAHTIAISMSFYTSQQVVEEHTERVLRSDLLAAQLLERRWAEFEIAQEELDAGGGRGRLQRRRAWEAQMNLTHEMGLSIGASTKLWRKLTEYSDRCATM